jgi:anti-sigma factor RsiW
MTNERDHDDLMRLNAFVDGEVSPSERAEIAARIASDRGFARQHALLQRLKAGVADYAMDDAEPAIALASSAPRRWPAWLGLGGGMAVAALLLVGAYFGTRTLRPAPVALDHNAIERLIVQAALPAAPVVPDLAAGGMTLSGVAVRETSAAPTLVASYTGPRGCRLELRVRRGGGESGDDGTARRGWTVGALHYELVAFGMPDIRFAIIAGAAERQSRLAVDPAGDMGLREARSAAPPCVG